MSDLPNPGRLEFSGDTFQATYRLIAESEKQALDIARAICVEQTVEFPVDLISREDILDGIVGKIRSIAPVAPRRYHVEISFSAEVAGDDLVQFLNVLFGNTGLNPGIRLMSFSLPRRLKKIFKGPRFGIDGLRRKLDAFDRPLLATALKPMGLDNKELARFAGAFAEGGIDIIKDDHGLADQTFTRFEDRVRRASDAVNEANARFSKNCLYLPNISGPAHLILERARFAKQAGAGGIMLAPGLTGFDIMRRAAEDDDSALPVLSHPSFLGPFVLSGDNGISHGLVFGLMNRVAGADIAVFPSFGGRFSFSKEECGDIVNNLRREEDSFAKTFPAPAGGMTVDRIAALLDFYGNDAVFLIGGDLRRFGDSPAESCREFLRRIEDRPGA